MPAYTNTSPPNSLAPGDLQNLWVTTDGNFVTNTKTQRVALAEIPGGRPKKLSLRVAYGAAPGVMSVFVQTSDTDVDADYVNLGPGIQAVTAANIARLELPNVVAKFARVFAATTTNAVTAIVDLAA